MRGMSSPGVSLGSIRIGMSDAALDLSCQCDR
jgi:hypothetical protein